MIRRLTAALMLLAGPGLAEPMDPILAAGGEWHGVGVQAGDIHWPIVVTLAPEGSDIAYPSFGCEGKWHTLKVTEAGLLAIEKITVGVGTCSNGGVVRVKPLADEQLEYVWYDATGQAAAKAVLVPGAWREDLYEALLKLTLKSLDLGFLSREDGPQDAPEL